MKSTNYQIQKEQESNMLSQINELVENNRFEEKTKETIKEAVDTAINAITENRKEVYSELNGHNPDDIAYHPKEVVPPSQKNLHPTEVKYVAHQCMEMISKLKTANSSPLNFVFDESTLKKHFPSDKFKQNEIALTGSLNAIINALSVVEEQEKKTDISSGADGETTPTKEEEPKKEKSIEDKPKKKKTLLDKIKGK